MLENKIMKQSKQQQQQQKAILEYIQRRPSCRVQHVPVPQGEESWARPPSIPEKDGETASIQMGIQI